MDREIRRNLAEVVLEALALERASGFELEAPVILSWVRVRGFRHKTAQAVSAALAALERAGLVYKLPPEPSARRRAPARVGLTQRASELLDGGGFALLLQQYAAAGAPTAEAGPRRRHRAGSLSGAG